MEQENDEKAIKEFESIIRQQLIDKAIEREDFEYAASVRDAIIKTVDGKCTCHIKVPPMDIVFVDDDAKSLFLQMIEYTLQNSSNGTI